MMRIIQWPFVTLVRSSSSELGVPGARGFASGCPFQTLGLKSKSKRISRSTTPAHRFDHTITYEQVRIAFRELALKHHPDTKKSSTGSSSSAEFTRIREAFEAIVEGPNGVAILRDDYSYRERSDRKDENEMDVPSTGAKKDYNSFDDEQNGFLHPSVNPQVLHEVADVVEKMNPGGLDKGGMWQYANMVHRMAKDESKGLPPLRVGGGSDDDAKEKSSVRRRRRRK